MKLLIFVGTEGVVKQNDVKYYIYMLLILYCVAVFTALLGVLLPFFGGLLGFFGGIAFTSLSYIVS